MLAPTNWWVGWHGACRGRWDMKTMTKYQIMLKLSEASEHGPAIWTDCLVFEAADDAEAAQVLSNWRLYHHHQKEDVGVARYDGYYQPSNVDRFRPPAPRKYRKPSAAQQARTERMEAALAKAKAEGRI